MTHYRTLPEVPLFRYGCILADPPWRYENYSRKGEHKGAAAKYVCVPTHILKRFKVADLAAPDCVMLMWATAPMLPDALALMEAWGFKFKSAASWAKRSKTGRGWAFGAGYWFRSASEFLLLGTMGKPAIRSRNQRNLIVAPVREHSRKPDEQYAMAEYVAAGPYLELFSRTDRQGWDSFGDQVGTWVSA